MSSVRLITQKQLKYLKDLDPSVDYSNVTRLEARQRIHELVNGTDKHRPKSCFRSHLWKRGAAVTDDVIELMCKRCGVIVHSHVQIADVSVKKRKAKDPLSVLGSIEGMGQDEI